MHHKNNLENIIQKCKVFLTLISIQLCVCSILLYVLVSKSFRDLLTRIEGTITEKREWNDSIFVPKGSRKRILIYYINIPVSRPVDSGVNGFI